MSNSSKTWLCGAAAALCLSMSLPAAHAERLKRVELPIDMSALDHDKDGKLSKEEAHISPTLLDDWPARDTNKDGFLDATELSTKADANANVGGTMGGKGPANGGGSAGGGGEGGSNGSSASGSGS